MNYHSQNYLAQKEILIRTLNTIIYLSHDYSNIILNNSLELLEHAKALHPFMVVKTGNNQRDESMLK